MDRVRSEIPLVRSKLFVPGNRKEMIAKAAASEADMVVIDLEDAVPPGQKEAARAIAVEALAVNSFEGKLVGVRVNSRASGLLIADILGVASAQLDLIQLPKAESAFDVQLTDEILKYAIFLQSLEATVGIIATLESPQALRNAREIAGASERVIALQYGIGDLTSAMQMNRTPGLLDHLRAKVTFAAFEAHVQAIDTAYPFVTDLDGFEAEARAARDWGFAGKSCIHPTQVPVANRVFSPTVEEAQRAAGIVKAYDEAQHQGVGAISHHGDLIDVPYAERARSTLETAKRLGILNDSVEGNKEGNKKARREP